LPLEKTILETFLYPTSVNSSEVEDPLEDFGIDEELEEEDHEFLLARANFDESLDLHIQQLHEFADALEYQCQFRDPRFLAKVEQKGAVFFWLAEECLDLEKQMQSQRSNRPTTLEGNGDSMFYRTRPASQTPS